MEPENMMPDQAEQDCSCTEETVTEATDKCCDKEGKGDRKKVKKLEGNDVLKSAEMLYNNTDIPVANGDSDGNGSNGGLLGGGDGDGTDNWLWLGMGAGAVLIIAVAIVLVLKSRKKRS